MENGEGMQDMISRACTNTGEARELYDTTLTEEENRIIDGVVTAIIELCDLSPNFKTVARGTLQRLNRLLIGGPVEADLDSD